MPSTITIPQDIFKAAKEAVGQTLEDRAAWLLGFCRGPLPRKVPDPMKSQLECALFVCIEVEVAVSAKGEVVAGAGQLPSLGTVQTFHDEMGRGLRELERGKPWEFDTRIRGQLTPSGDHIAITAGQRKEAEGLFLASAIATLVAGKSAWRFCANETCHRLFVRNKSRGRPQIYCSPTCEGTVSKRN